MFRMLVLNARKICLNINADCSFTITTTDGTIDKAATLYLNFNCIENAVVTKTKIFLKMLPNLKGHFYKTNSVFKYSVVHLRHVNLCQFI